ncbi:ATPase-stabilizing factor 15 kDa protein [Escovopsis weberi]|uniref:ATPase-stabilizing factor 15 kDa protein n=1 Tax=Escovopsis weberi TaxID=150374 RepID=A0A0M8MX13_ESCWE|nr:ATPase-stabilizing factor 15 kDa protein [Escovopsis weberi]
MDASFHTVTRSHKYNDRDHRAAAEGASPVSENLPKFFAKTGFLDADPKKIKKDGGGRGNWGGVGDEVVDEEFTFTNTRRRSNSSSFSHITEFKTKFEVNDEPVFEESIHGPLVDDDTGDTHSKTDSSESGRSE